MWKTEIFAVLVQIVLLYSVVDVHWRPKFGSDSSCHGDRLADRFVLMISSHFDLSNVTTEPLLQLRIAQGISGQMRSELENCVGLSGLFYGTTKGPLDFFNHGKEESIFDVIETINFGRIHLNDAFYRHLLRKNISMELLQLKNRSSFFDLQSKNLSRYVEYFESRLDNKTLYILISRNENRCQRDFLIWGSGVKNASNLHVKQVDVNALITSFLGKPPLKKSIGIPPNYTHLAPCYSTHLTSLTQSYYSQVRFLYKMTKFNKMKGEEHQNIIKESKILMQNTLFYLNLVTYIGWMFLLMLNLLIIFKDVVKMHHEKEKTSPKFNTFFILLCFASFLFVLAHKWPTHSALYFILPLIIWRVILDKMANLRVLLSLKRWEYVTSLIGGVLLLAEAEFIFWSIRSRLIALAGYVFVFLFYLIRGVAINWNLTHLIVMSVSGATFAVLMFVPVIPNGSYILLNIGGTVWFSGALASSFFMMNNYRDFVTMSFCIIHLLGSLIISNLVIKKMLSSCILIATGLVGQFIPILGGSDELNRIKMLSTVTISLFIVYSVNYELISMFCLVVYYVSMYLYDKRNRPARFPSRTDMYYSYFYVILLFTCYQSLGYNEDLDKIDLSYLTRLGDFKCPFMKGMLIVVKSSVIVVLLSVIFCAIHKGNKAHSLLAIVILNLIGFRFFLDACLNLNYERPEPQLLRYCVTQVTIIVLLTFSCFIRAVLYTQVGQVVQSLKSSCKGRFERQADKEDILTAIEK